MPVGSAEHSLPGFGVLQVPFIEFSFSDFDLENFHGESCDAHDSLRTCATFETGKNCELVRLRFARLTISSLLR